MGRKGGSLSRFHCRHVLVGRSVGRLVGWLPLGLIVWRSLVLRGERVGVDGWSFILNARQETYVSCFCCCCCCHVLLFCLQFQCSQQQWHSVRIYGSGERHAARGSAKVPLCGAVRWLTRLAVDTRVIPAPPPRPCPTACSLPRAVRHHFPVESYPSRPFARVQGHTTTAIP